LTSTGPVRSVAPIGATPLRFPSADGAEAALAEANAAARAFSAAVVDEILPGFDVTAVAAGGDQEGCCLVEPGAALDGLLGVEDLDRLLRESLHPLDGDAHRGWHPRVFRAGERRPPIEHVSQDALLADGRGGRIDPYRLATAFRSGGSLYLRDAVAHHLPLRRLVEHLRRVLGGSGDVGVFVSHGRADAPLGSHWDETENFAFQLVGRRHWEVRRPSIPNNHYALLQDDGVPGEVAWSGVLEPGQALTVPRAWWHEVTPVDDGLSVSLTVGVNRPIAHDALHWLLPLGARVDDLRRPLPQRAEAGGPDALRAVRALLAELDDDAFLAHLQARELPLAAAGPGLSELLAVERPADLVVRTQLPGAVSLVEGADALTLAAAGRQVTVDPAYAGALGTVLAGPPVLVGDLFPLGPTAEGVAQLVDQLLRLDWCAPARLDEDPLARSGRG
jgi:hypothetical protein